MIKCNTCKQQKFLNRINFKFVDGKYLIDKCKACYNYVPKSATIVAPIPIVPSTQVKTLKPQKRIRSFKVLTKKCRKCEVVLDKRQFKRKARNCMTCQEAKTNKSNVLDRFCGICLSTQGLVFMSGARTAPKTLCDIHHHEYSQVQQRLQYHNLSFITYRNMLIAQRGKCAICRKPSSNLLIDHCHVSGNVRALLCNKCNMYLGVIENTIVDGTYLKYVEYSQTYAENDISNLKTSF